jgi:hypothetical protein
MSASTELFKYFNKNNVFVETGAMLGNGIQQALDAGYSKIISIEYSEYHANFCKNRFLNNLNVTVIHGDSSKILYDIIKDIEEPITFWLDAHYSGCGDYSNYVPTACGINESSLIEELDQIKKHKLNTHTIMIDDIRCWVKSTKTSPEVLNLINFDKIDLENKIKNINSNYVLEYVDGWVEKDILVGYLQ